MTLAHTSARLRGRGRGVLDIAMIVRDEEVALPRALASLEELDPIMGRVIVYDTGSSDRTCDVAEAWGAQVIKGHWDDDFSRARNAGLAAVRSDWFLQLDADEIVMADTAALKKLLDSHRQAGATACSLPMVFVNEHDQVISTMQTVRVGRRGKVRFRNRVHETLAPRDGMHDLVRRSIPEAVLTLAHFGYVDAEAVQRKGERNLRISLTEDSELSNASPDRAVEVLVNRGRSLQIMGDTTAAIVEFERAWAIEGARPALKQWAGEQLVEHLLVAGRPEEAEALLPALHQVGADRQYIDHVRAEIRLGEQAYQAALDSIRRVDRPRRAMGMAHSWASALRIRAISAAAVGQHDEAVAAIVSLLAKHGLGPELIPLLLALWGDRPVEILASLLRDAGTGYLDETCHDLAAHGARGECVADAYRRMAHDSPHR